MFACKLSVAILPSVAFWPQVLVEKSKSPKSEKLVTELRNQNAELKRELEAVRTQAMDELRNSAVSLATAELKAKEQLASAIEQAYEKGFTRAEALYKAARALFFNKDA